MNDSTAFGSRSQEIDLGFASFLVENPELFETTNSVIPFRGREGAITQQPDETTGLKETGDHFPPLVAVTSSDETKKLEDYTIKEIEKFIECEEFGDATLALELLKDKIVYSKSEGEWYRWKDGHWRKADADTIRNYVFKTLSNAYRSFAFLRETTVQEGSKSGSKLFSEILKDRAKALGRVTRVKAVVTAMTGIEELCVDTEQWDTHDFLLGVENGVVDLRTGKLIEVRQDMYIRRIAPTLWRGLHEPCPTWENFLREVFADHPNPDETIACLQRIIGYCITNSIREHKTFFFYGRRGRNGKGLIKETINAIFGKDLSSPLHVDVLIGKKRGAGQGPEPFTMMLKGRRMAWASETTQGDRLNHQQLKLLVGGDTLPTRGMYKDAEAIKPTHKILLLTNYLPHADADDDALWARLVMLPFNQHFIQNPDPSNKNERLADDTIQPKLLEEASGILAWTVRGCLDWQKQGLGVTQFMRDLLHVYRKDEDRFEDFIQDMCLVGSGGTVQSSTMFKAYQEWAKERGHEPTHIVKFTEKMKFKGEKYGFEHGRVGSHNQWKGLRLIGR